MYLNVLEGKENNDMSKVIKCWTKLSEAIFPGWGVSLSVPSVSVGGSTTTA